MEKELVKAQSAREIERVKEKEMRKMEEAALKSRKTLTGRALLRRLTRNQVCLHLLSLNLVIFYRA